jgi:hypothetical protein
MDSLVVPVAVYAGGKVTDPVEWKPFGFEFKPGKSFATRAGASKLGFDSASSFDPDRLPDAG